MTFEPENYEAMLHDQFNLFSLLLQLVGWIVQQKILLTRHRNQYGMIKKKIFMFFYDQCLNFSNMYNLWGAEFCSVYVKIKQFSSTNELKKAFVWK